MKDNIPDTCINCGSKLKFTKIEDSVNKVYTYLCGAKFYVYNFFKECSTVHYRCCKNKVIDTVD